MGTTADVLIGTGGTQTTIAHANINTAINTSNVIYEVHDVFAIDEVLNSIKKQQEILNKNNKDPYKNIAKDLKDLFTNDLIDIGPQKIVEKRRRDGETKEDKQEEKDENVRDKMSLFFKNFGFPEEFGKLELSSDVFELWTQLGDKAREAALILANFEEFEEAKLLLNLHKSKLKDVVSMKPSHFESDVMEIEDDEEEEDKMEVDTEEAVIQQTEDVVMSNNEDDVIQQTTDNVISKNEKDFLQQHDNIENNKSKRRRKMEGGNKTKRKKKKKKTRGKKKKKKKTKQKVKRLKYTRYKN